MDEFHSFEDIQRAKRVVPLSVVKEILKRTEPVGEHMLATDGSSEVRVKMPIEWNHDLKPLDDSVLTSCKIFVGEDEYALTKKAVLTLLALAGFSDRYAYKCPGDLLETHVNYWFSHEGIGTHPEIKMVTSGNYAVGFMNPNLPIVSNLDVLTRIERFVRNEGHAKELFVDPNIIHNYAQTDFRLIFSDEAFEVETVRNGEPETDVWHYGLHVTNSLVSGVTRPLTISGFMVEQRTLAGILPEYSNISGYSRSADMDIEDLHGWIASTLEQIFSIMPSEAEMIKHMSEHTLKGKVGKMTTDLFRSMKVHRKVQELALENLTLSGDMTSYGIMHAMAKAVAVSATKFPPKIINHVQQVCGTLPSRTEEICDSCGRLHLFD